jgi:hypothetical protein
MTDRVHSITLVLDQDIRTDDIEPLITACRMLKHVIRVEENIADPTSLMAYSRAVSETRQLVWDALAKADEKR